MADKRQTINASQAQSVKFTNDASVVLEVDIQGDIKLTPDGLRLIPIDGEPHTGRKQMKGMRSAGGTLTLDIMLTKDLGGIRPEAMASGILQMRFINGVVWTMGDCNFSGEDALPVGITNGSTGEVTVAFSTLDQSIEP